MGGIALLAALMGCSGTEPLPVSEAEVRDSAGVVLRVFPGDLPLNDVELEPVWVHGHAAGDYEFQRVFRGVLHGAGGAIVGDGGNRELVMIPDDGSSFSVIAASGEGPEEIGRPGAVVRAGLDSVWVQDRGNSRLTLFVRGAIARTISTAGDEQLSFYLMPIGVAPGGELLMTTGAYRPDFEEAWFHGSLVRLSPEELSADTVGSYPMAPRREEPVNPFAAYGQAVSAGRSFVTVRTDVPEVRWWDADGGLARIDRWSPDPVHPTEADLDAYIASMREALVRMNPRIRGEELQTFVDEQVARYALDRSLPLPVFRWIVGGEEGGVWLAEESGASMTSSSYRVLAPDGSVGRADFGRTVSVLDTSGDLVLALLEDELDVQALGVWRYRVAESRVGPER